MNIGIDIRSLMTPHRTGVGQYAFELLDALLQIDNDNNYFLFGNSAKDSLVNIPPWNLPNVHYVLSRWPNKLFNASIKLSQRPKIDEIIRKKTKQKIDLFISPNLNFIALNPNVKKVLVIHDLSFLFFPDFFRFKQRLWHWAINAKKSCQTADLIITPSISTKNDIIKHLKINEEKIKAIYPGISKKFLETSQNMAINNAQDEFEKIVKQKYGLPDRFLLFLGTIEPRKNISALVKAFEMCAGNIPSDIHLVIAGAPGWKNKKIFSTIKKSKSFGRIKFVGHVDEADKPTLYSLSSIFIYPSVYEGFGFPILEAMATKVPVITSNRSSLPEVAGDAAYFVNPNRPTLIMEGIKRVLNSSPLRNQLISQGTEQEKKFRWSNFAKQLLDYTKII
ncbi:MAG: glycosyltransferase family 1 protein [bacterium]